MVAGGKSCCQRVCAEREGAGACTPHLSPPILYSLLTVLVKPRDKPLPTGTSAGFGLWGRRAQERRMENGGEWKCKQNNQHTQHSLPALKSFGQIPRGANGVCISLTSKRLVTLVCANPNYLGWLRKPYGNECRVLREDSLWISAHYIGIGIIVIVCCIYSVCIYTEQVSNENLPLKFYFSSHRVSIISQKSSGFATDQGY